MSLSPLRRSRSVLVAAAVALSAALCGLTSTSATAATSVAAPRTAVQSTAVQSAAVRSAAAGHARVADLRLIGTTTRVTVRRVHRTGQVTWINYVLDSRLVDLDGCQARRATSWRTQVYRASVYAVCPSGPGTVEAAARALTASRPWYRVSVSHVPLVAFTLLADLPSGNGRAVPAAVAQLPSGPSVFFEGDDVSLVYSGPGVSQAELDAAIGAFAHALGIPTSKVTVSPLAAG